VADWAVQEYPQRRYPAVVVGSSHGALTHLYAACSIRTDAVSIVRHGYWTYFPTGEAAQVLADYLDGHTFDEIDIMLFSHGTRSRGLAEVDSWEQLANRARRRGRLLAVDRSAFPADFVTFARYTPALRRLPRATHPHSPLSVDAALHGLSQSTRLSVVG
jgi:hypothetical protein